MSTPLPPNSELIAKHWLLAALPAYLDNNVATTLPDPGASWANNEFVQIMSVGGTPDSDLPRLNPVVSLNVYAMRPNSTKPPWNKAQALAMRIWEATYQIRYADDPAYTLDLPAPYQAAQVQSVWAVSDVRRIPQDPSQFAVYNLDLAFSWVPADLIVPR